MLASVKQSLGEFNYLVCLYSDIPRLHDATRTICDITRTQYIGSNYRQWVIRASEYLWALAVVVVLRWVLVPNASHLA